MVVNVHSQLNLVVWVQYIFFEFTNVRASPVSHQPHRFDLGFDLDLLIQKRVTKLRSDDGDSPNMLHLLHFFRCNERDFPEAFDKLTILFRRHNFCGQIVSYLKIVDNLLILGIWGVEAEMRLREPFGQVNCERIAV